jgi:cytochrome c oxidase cbb3-type subunit 4
VTIDEGSLRGGIAVVSLATFVGVCWWAYRPRSRARFEADALLVFDEGERAGCIADGSAPARRTERSRRKGARRAEEGASA